MVASAYFYTLLSMLVLLPLSTSLTISSKLGIPRTQIKCGNCPCFYPCYVKSPSPPPPPKPCTPAPPPPPRFVFVTAFPGMTDSPGSLYQSDPQNDWKFYSGIGPHTAEPAIFAACGMLLFMVLGI